VAPELLPVTGTLSAREGAGLYLVRRARTLTAPHQLRLLATAFVGVLVLDLGRIHLRRLQGGEAVSWAAAVAEVLSYLAIALVLWRPALGLAVAAVVLSVGVLTGGTGTEPVLLLVVGAVTLARAARRWWTVFLVGAGCCTLLNLVARPDQAAFVLLWFGGAAAVGAGLGVAGRRLVHLRDGTGRRLAELAEEDARLRADERRLLARELHDVVSHQLANISLQVMSHQDSVDADELRRVLRRLDRFSQSALTELRLLVRVLRDDPATAPGADEVGELSSRVPPTMAAADWARRLVAAGFDPDIDVPAQADRLEMTVQATVTRALDVTCDNIVKHAPARAHCSVALSLNPTQVVLRTASPLGPPQERTALGWSLRGLRERVDLAGGAFTARSSTAGATDPEWVVTLTLPR
jgi:signal transduction histidine kinase